MKGPISSGPAIDDGEEAKLRAIIERGGLPLEPNLWFRMLLRRLDVTRWERDRQYDLRMQAEGKVTR